MKTWVVQELFHRDIRYSSLRDKTIKGYCSYNHPIWICYCMSAQALSHKWFSNTAQMASLSKPVPLSKSFRQKKYLGLPAVAFQKFAGIVRYLLTSTEKLHGSQPSKVEAAAAVQNSCLVQIKPSALPKTISLTKGRNPPEIFLALLRK